MSTFLSNPLFLVQFLAFDQNQFQPIKIDGKLQDENTATFIILILIEATGNLM